MSEKTSDIHSGHLRHDYRIKYAYFDKMLLKKSAVGEPRCIKIPTTLECKDHLSVLLDSNLSWKFHINNVALKVSRTVGVVARVRHFVPRTTLLNIYQSFSIASSDIRLAA